MTCITDGASDDNYKKIATRGSGSETVERELSMIEVYSLTKGTRASAPYVLVYTNSECPDRTVFQGSEEEVLAMMENGGLTGEEIDRWFETANPSAHPRNAVKDVNPP